MNHAEKVLLSHLTSADSLDYLVREGFSTEFNRECVPTDEIRDIVGWVIDLFYKSGRTVAPTKAGIMETWWKELEKLDIAIEDDYETDSIEWCVEELRSVYVAGRTNEFTIKLANDVFNAAPPDKVDVVKAASGDLHALVTSVTSHHQEMPADLGFEDAWMRYQERAAARNFVQGMTFGLPEIDNHTMGIRDGEIATFAAYSGVGKSWVSIKVALAEWRRGRRSVLFTLENDLEMTYDRMACMMAGLSYERWQRGRCDEGSLVRFHTSMQRLQDTEHGPIALMPEEGDRDPVSMVRRAFSLGAESMIVDQVSHVEPMPGSRAHKRNEVVAEIMRGFKHLVGGGREKIPLLVLGQISREGLANARKSGRHEMPDVAESAEMERGSDFLFTGLSQHNEGDESGLLWQKLKGRRVDPMPEAWEMIWRLGVGDIRVLREVTRA
jgi:hypothetical protein